MKQIVSVTFSLLVLTMNLLAQQYRQGNIPEGFGNIIGKVIDQETSQPVEYANIVIFRLPDSTMVTGTITKPDGTFILDKIPFGIYYIKIRFIGYNEKFLDRVMVRPKNPETDLGTIQLMKYTEELEGVEITAEKPKMEYKIDKKVVYVDQNLVSAGGTAADVLENTPSVKVDLEGNVSLRGSSNFTVLIDGKPTLLKPSDVLQQIPASTIENIEVITNPSAKYDPDGTAGIINVITKKQKLEGISGIMTTTLGTNNKYGIDLLLNYRTDKFNFFVGGQINDNKGKGTGENNNETSYNDTTTFNYSKGNRHGGRYGWSIKTGTDIYLNRSNTLTLSVEKDMSGHERNSLSDYTIWTFPATNELDYRSTNNHRRESDEYGLNIEYQRKFKKKGHEMYASFNFRSDQGEEDNYTSTNTLADEIIYGQKANEDGTSADYRFKIDYILPVKDKNKFEAGYQSRFEMQNEDYFVDTFDISSDAWFENPLYSVQTEYHRNIHAIYAIYSGEYKKLGYQFGLRGENTDRLMEHSDTNIQFRINRFDIFPTVHFSFQLPADQQLLLSYSRRIERPRNYYLEPFYTWMDAYNVRVGNPGIKPEYINSMELSYQKKLKTSFIAIEAYYRQTINHIERIRSVYAPPNIMLHSSANVGQEASTGVELMLNLNLLRWLNVNTSFDYYNYQLKGTLFDKSIDASSNDWSIRLNSTFKLNTSTRFQIDGRYSSPSVTAQGERKENYSANLGFRKELFKKKLTATLQYRDIFGTGKYEFLSEGDSFKSYTKFTRETQVLILTLSYKINNYQKKKERNAENGNMYFDEEF